MNDRQFLFLMRCPSSRITYCQLNRSRCARSMIQISKLVRIIYQDVCVIRLVIRPPRYGLYLILPGRRGSSEWTQTSLFYVDSPSLPCCRDRLAQDSPAATCETHWTSSTLWRGDQLRALARWPTKCYRVPVICAHRWGTVPRCSCFEDERWVR